MRQLFCLAAAAAAVVAPATPSAAQERAYVSVFTGFDAPSDETISGRNAAGDLRDISVAFDNGALFGAALGVVAIDRSSGRARAEVEFTHRKSELESLTLNDVDRSVTDGSEVSVSSGMVNVFYDTPQVFERVRFSLGAGFGAAMVDHKIRYLIAVPPATGSIPGQIQIGIPTSEATYAYQLIGGAEIALSPTLSLTGDIRYFNLGEAQVERFVLNSIINGVPTTIGTLDSILDADYATTSLTVGLRYRF